VLVLSAPCAYIVCFFGTVTIFLPAPIVARKVLGSNSRFFLLPTVAAGFITMILVQINKGFRSEPFCTVFRKAMGQSVDSSRERFTRQTRRRTKFLSGACPDKVVRGQFSVVFIGRNPQPIRPPTGGHLVRASPNTTVDPSRRRAMHRADLLKPDLLSEIVLLGAGALIFAALLFVTVTALARS